MKEACAFSGTYISEMVALSHERIHPLGFMFLQSNTSYTLMCNLVIDGIALKGIRGGDSTTHVDGRGYMITISGLCESYFPMQIHLEHITLVDIYSYQSWGNAIPADTCYAFTGPLSGTHILTVADISSRDHSIHLLAGNTYFLSGEFTNISRFNGFKVDGSGNTMIDCNGYITPMQSIGGLFQPTTTQSSSILVKHLIVDASGKDLSNGNGWIFGKGFLNMIAIQCRVTCGFLEGYSGGIFGGRNSGFVQANDCVVDCKGIRNNGGSICGGGNIHANICLTDCSATNGELCGGENIDCSIPEWPAPSLPPPPEIYHIVEERVVPMIQPFEILPNVNPTLDCSYGQGQCPNIITYPSTYYLGEEQRTEDKRVLISNPEIRTAFGHKFLSQADRISILRRNIFLCTQ